MDNQVIGKNPGEPTTLPPGTTVQPTQQIQPQTPTETLANAVQALPQVEGIIAEVGHVKTGWKTSEFWQTLLVNVATTAGVIYPSDPIVLRYAGLLVIVVNTLSYLQSRLSLKKHAITAKAQVMGVPK